MRTYAQLTTSFVVFCNRVGVDESISFWGGSEVIAPTGAAVFSAPLYDEGLFTVDIAPARHPPRARSRCRCCATSAPSSRSRELARHRRRARRPAPPTRRATRRRAGLDVAAGHADAASDRVPAARGVRGAP